jgi:hypothetical protein
MVGGTENASRLSGTLQNNEENNFCFFYSPHSVLVRLFLLLAFFVSMIPASASR